MMMDDKLTCAEVLDRIAVRRGKIKQHERAIANIKSRCAHDETREERDYQDPKSYRVCLGCGKGLP